MNTKVSGKTALTGAAGVPSGIAIAPVLVWLFNLMGVDIPAEVAAAIGGLVATVATFLVAWLVPAKEGSYVVTEPLGDGLDPNDAIVESEYDDPEPGEVVDPEDDSYVDVEVTR